MTGVQTCALPILLKLPTTHGDVSGIMDSVPKAALDYLKSEKPEAVDLLNQVVKGVPYYMAIPLVLVIVLAIAKFNTFICIGSGIVSAYLLGLPAGTTGKLTAYLDLCKSAFGEAGSWVVVIMACTITNNNRYAESHISTAFNSLGNTPYVNDSFCQIQPGCIYLISHFAYPSKIGRASCRERV